jgi:hypothetical protein
MEAYGKPVLGRTNIRNTGGSLRLHYQAKQNAFCEDHERMSGVL